LRHSAVRLQPGPARPQHGPGPDLPGQLLGADLLPRREGVRGRPGPAAGGAAPRRPAPRPPRGRPRAPAAARRRRPNPAGAEPVPPPPRGHQRKEAVTTSPDTGAGPPPAPRDTPMTLLNTQYLPSSRDWRTPAGRADSPFRADTFVREAQRAEAAGADAFFPADFSGVDRANLRSGPPVNAFEPFQLAALVAAATTRIPVMPTVSTLYNHPFTFARNLARLDRISGGRAWVDRQSVV